MKNIFSLAILISLLVALALKPAVYLASSEHTPSIIAGYETSYWGFPQLPQSWFSLVHMSHNAYHSWRLDPLLALLSFKLAATPQQQVTLYFLGLFLLLSAGSFLYFRSFGVARVACASATALLISSLLACLGADIVVFGSLCWLPWLLLALRRDHSQLLPQLYIVAAASALALSAHFFAPLLAAFAVVLQPTRARIALVVFAPALFSALLMPLPEMPQYPAHARLVQEDPELIGNVCPHFAGDAAMKIVDRLQLRSATRPLLGLLALALLCLGALRAGKHRAHALAFALFAALSLDLLLPEPYAQLGPLAVLLRCLPGLYFTSLVPIAIALCLLSLISAILLERSAQRAGCSSLALLLLVLLNTVFLNSGHPWLLDKQALAPVHTAQQDSRKLELLISPSYSILRRHGTWLLATDLKNIIDQAFIPAAPYLASVQGFPNDKPTRLLKSFDDTAATRWSSGGSGQSGAEWLELHFTQPIHLRGIEPAVGSFQTDFPRALLLTDCSATRTSEWSYSATPWIGSLGLTQTGLPYYRGHADLRIYFPETLPTDCLRIQQVGKDAIYDWSVAELRLLLEENR